MKRPLALILFAYIAGIIIGNYIQIPLSFVLPGILGLNIVLLIFFFSNKKKAALFTAPAIFGLFGILYIGAVLYPDFSATHIIHLAGDKKYCIEGILYKAPEPLPEKTRLYVAAEGIHLEEGRFPVTGNLLLTLKETRVDFRYGDRVRFISKLYVPRPATNPGAFDYRRFLGLQEIWVTAFVNRSDEVLRVEEGKGNPFFHFVESCREKIRVFFDQNGPPESRGIIKALVIGERGDISQETNEKFIITGVNHILSISGLHVALVAAFFFALTRFLLKLFPSLLLRFDLQKTAALVAILPVIFYTFIAGLGVAAVRSAVMVLSFLLVLLLDREKDLYDALFLAAFGILIVSPGALFDISFQLSFLAVAALAYFIPPFKEYLSAAKIWPENKLETPSFWKRKLWAYIGASLLTSLAATLGTGPLVAHYFNRLSLVGFITNLFLVPLMGFLNTLLSLLAAFMVFVAQPLAKILTVVNVFIMSISLALVDFMSRLSWASVRVATPTVLEILLMYGMLVFLANLRRWKKALWGLVCLGVGLGIVQIHEFYSVRYGKELNVTFLDVGQGDAAVVRFPGGKTMVIDGGGSPDGSFDPGERIVAPYLWRNKVKKIDTLVNTHPHPDHLQGLIFLLDNFAVEKVWSNGEPAEDSPLLETFLGSSGERLQMVGQGVGTQEVNGVKIEFLHPLHDPGKHDFSNTNDGSLVLRLTYGEVSLLFCGDIEAAAEEEILTRGGEITSTIMKVPHHGSKTSSTPGFLEKVRPKYAVFTVRGGKRVPLPNPAVLERYGKMGVKIYRSDRDGAVTFVTDGKNLKVHTFFKRKDTEKTN
jgi:competence protein ComEC